MLFFFFHQTCDVPAVLTDDGSSDSAGAADGEVPAEVHERGPFPGTASHEAATNSRTGQNAAIPDSEDVPIEVVEVDVENTGDVPDAPFNDSLDGVPPITGTSTALDNHLCDVSDDEMDQLPRARPNKELDELVDCDGFRNGTGRASSIPPESPPPGESFIYDTNFSPMGNKRSGPSTSSSNEFNGTARKIPRQVSVHLTLIFIFIYLTNLLKKKYSCQRCTTSSVKYSQFVCLK
ncbi:hypothetical protein OESDEN_00141 [Oesophagostomum dentatum]|uniref:Uncharacterized protein n=1 Tax=Oesophagostomum dentatum TaxID=61180 RepID=A0A0B1TVE9_OESDE|nr:hypothetical protein OESDEN_00141 [Oesophagostomum dentatum]